MSSANDFQSSRIYLLGVRTELEFAGNTPINVGNSSKIRPRKQEKIFPQGQFRLRLDQILGHAMRFNSIWLLGEMGFFRDDYVLFSINSELLCMECTDGYRRFEREMA